jgi:hypothetical protein
MADPALLGAAVGGVIGLAAQTITARYAKQQRWMDTRRELYARYLEQISVGRRRLVRQVRRKLDGAQDSVEQDRERRDAFEAAVAGWNQIALVTRSTALVNAAYELQLRVSRLYRMLEGQRACTDERLKAEDGMYEENRLAYINAVQLDLRLKSRWTAWFVERNQARKVSSRSVE